MSQFRSNQVTIKEMVAFETEVAALYADGKIKAPVHLRSGCEAQLLEIFEKVLPQDWIFGYWATHLHCMLKGISTEVLRKEILSGKSISLCFPEEKIYCSGIVGSLAGVAVGTAYSNKLQGKNEHVWLFTGDMGAETGIFHEALKFSVNYDLPITFVVEDNDISVHSETRLVWKDPEPWFKGTKYEKKVIYFRYKNGWPHSGIGKRIAF